MRLKASEIAGLEGAPGTMPGVRKWLKNRSIPIFSRRGKGGIRHEVDLSSLPSEVRLAWLSRDLEKRDLDPGSYDDAAHAVFLQASPSRRDRAERKAAIARYLVSMGTGLSWAERTRLVQEKFGRKGTSKPRLMAILKAIKGVDPINFAPALLDRYKAPERRAAMTDEAWRFFMTLIRDAAPEFPLIQAWRDTRDVAAGLGWAWPSWPTVHRRWCSLSEAQRLAARSGRAQAAKALTIPASRDKTTVFPMQAVSMDGRMQDFWVDMGDGRPVRPIMIMLSDIASNMILDFELVASENAAATLRLIKRACERYGIFDQLWTDNGTAFSGHLVAGGNAGKFRNRGAVHKPVQPPGICKIMGIDLRFHIPGNPKAKIAERVFATLSRGIDDRPEFKGAHAGHAPGASPSPQVQPVPFDVARRILERETRRYNQECGRRAQGANGRSYQQVFEDGLRGRITRKPTNRQLYYAGLVYSPVSVDRHGQVKKDGWIYGSWSTQQALLRHHGTGRQILLGRDPDDFGAPAIAFDAEGGLICEGIEAVSAGKYMSADGAREAARNIKAARKAAAEAERANDYLTDHEFRQAMQALGAGHGRPRAQDGKVVAGHFTSPLRPGKDRKKAGPKEVVPPKFLENIDASIAARRGRGGKPA